MTSFVLSRRVQIHSRSIAASSSSLSSREPITRTRIRLFSSKCDRQEPVTTHLICNHGLTVNITDVLFEADGVAKQFDLELIGTTAQIQSGLAYLHSLDLKIQGKANVDGDSWHY